MIIFGVSIDRIGNESGTGCTAVVEIECLVE